jgi:hypothetical protein
MAFCRHRDRAGFVAGVFADPLFCHRPADAALILACQA